MKLKHIPLWKITNKYCVDVTFDFNQWYLLPYYGRNPATNTSFLRFLFLGLHVRYPAWGWWKDIEPYQEY